jgi:hypothetical protein
MSLAALNSQNPTDSFRSEIPTESGSNALNIIIDAPVSSASASVETPKSSESKPRTIQFNEESNTIYKINESERPFGMAERSMKSAGNGKSLRGDFEAWLNTRKDKTENVINSNVEQAAKADQIIKLVNRIDAARSSVAAELAYQQEKELEFERLKQEKILQKQKDDGGSSSLSLDLGLSNIIAGAMNLTLSESAAEKREKVEKFEKFLGLDGLRVSLYVPITEEDEELSSPGGVGSKKQQSRAKLVVIRYEKFGDFLVFENKIHGQYQRLKISVVDDIASVNRGYGSALTPATIVNNEDRSAKFLNIQLFGKPELNLEFQSVERREVAFREFSRLVEVKKADAPPKSATPKAVTASSSFAGDDEDKVSSFMKSTAAQSKLDASFYNNTIKANKSLHIAAVWFKWLRFIVRDAYSSNNKKTGQPVFSFGSTTYTRERLVVISTGGIVSYFKLHDDIKDENIASKLMNTLSTCWLDC